jgi:hypothetical protein
VRAYRDRASFRALKILLWFDWRFLAIVTGFVLSPCLFMGMTIGVIAFCLGFAFVSWAASIPQWNWTEDGMMYEMDASERAEWVIENQRFPAL